MMRDDEVWTIYRVRLGHHVGEWQVGAPLLAEDAEVIEVVKRSALLAEREARERAEEELRSTARDLLDAAVARGDFEADRDAAVARAEQAETEASDLLRQRDEWANHAAREGLRAEQAEAERDELRKKLRDVEETLKPFAALAEQVDRLRHGDDSTCPHRLRAGDLRAARAALSPDPSGEAKPDDPFAVDRRPG